MNPNLVIIPTRDRPHNAKRAFNQLSRVSVESDFLMVVNEDQQELYNFNGYQAVQYDGVKREVVPNGLGANGKVNHILHKYWDSYDTITGIDDDCMVTTPEWDRLLAAPIKARGYGVSYGDDGMQHANLPTKVMISTNIIKTLGFFAPPTLFHLYCDNFWKMLGENLGALNYLPNVAMEHWHYLNGKAPIDDLYKSVYDPQMVENDRQAFGTYLKEQFVLDIKKLYKELGI